MAQEEKKSVGPHGFVYDTGSQDGFCVCGLPRGHWLHLWEESHAWKRSVKMQRAIRQCQGTPGWCAEHRTGVPHDVTGEQYVE